MGEVNAPEFSNGSSPDGVVSAITFNDGQSLKLAPDCIVVFVGPNNVGKSQSLKDIFELLGQPDSPTTVINSIQINKPDKTEIEEMLKSGNFLDHSNGNQSYRGFNFDIFAPYLNDYDFHQAFPNGFREFLSALVDTEKRLQISNQAAPRSVDMPKQHPIDYVADEESRSVFLAESFKKAFGTSVTADVFNGAGGLLRIGDPVEIEAEKIDDSGARMYRAALAQLKPAHVQGDGMRGFLGVMLYLMIEHYRIILIDEPEAFLHPPQAHVMGQCIGKALSNRQQAFISTHSKDIIRGLLEQCPSRVMIVRITRDKDENTFSMLDNANISSIWSDSLLRHSEILDGLFHSSTVLCESDSDCKIYSIVKESIDKESGARPDTLFTHCGGKPRMHHVASSLSKLKLNPRIVVDMDILGNENDLKQLYEACGGDWDTLEKDYRAFAGSLPEPTNDISQDYLRVSILEILDREKDISVSDDALRKIRRLAKRRTKWTELKEYGEEAIKSLQAFEQYENIKQALTDVGIFLVPCGEPERFIRASGHGPTWVNNVLSNHPDLGDEAYDNLKAFVQSWDL